MAELDVVSKTNYKNQYMLLMYKWCLGSFLQEIPRWTASTVYKLVQRNPIGLRCSFSTLTLNINILPSLFPSLNILVTKNIVICHQIFRLCGRSSNSLVVRVLVWITTLLVHLLIVSYWWLNKLFMIVFVSK